MSQLGSLYVIKDPKTRRLGDTCYLKYYTVIDGKRVHKTVELCKRSDVYDWWEKRGKRGFSSAVHDLQREKMDSIKAAAKAAEDAALALAKGPTPGEMSVRTFWDTRFLPYCEEIIALTEQPRKKPSTVRGYKQIWNQHLKQHFGETTLRDYEPWMGTDFLQGLTATQGKATLKHIKALGSSLFKRAVIERRIKVNPWHDVEIPDDAIVSQPTEHYTLAEAEDIISALVEHVDCQLVLALSCFLGLRPGEIAALQWSDFDTDNDTVNIRRSVVRGDVISTKTPESMAPLPLLMQVRIPLELWRQESGRKEGYVFESRNGTPIDLHNLVARVIRPHVEGPAYRVKGKEQTCVRCNKVPKASGVAWKTLYAGRRGAATAVIEANNGNLAIGQALLRHKSQITTATFYKKAITPQAFAAGMKKLELAAKGESVEG